MLRCEDLALVWRCEGVMAKSEGKRDGCDDMGQ